MSQAELNRLYAPLRQRRAELLTRFFAENRDAVEPLVRRHADAGHAMALWMASRDTVEDAWHSFAQAIDPEARTFSWAVPGTVEPLDPPAIPYPVRDMPRGLTDARVVFAFLKNLYQQQVCRRWGKLTRTEYVFVEDLIWEHVAHMHAQELPAAQPAGRQSVCSTTVMYNPGPDVVEAVASYAPHVDRAFLFDNSPAVDDDLRRQLEALPHVEYIWEGGVNAGLSTPNNAAYERALDGGFDWLITFDHDSVASTGMIQTMRAFAESAECTPNIALVGPLICKGRFRPDRYLRVPKLTFRNRIIQSGMMHRVSAMREIGPYDERLFIDEVENDYCARARERGFDVVRVNNAALLHQIHDKVDRDEVDKYSNMRFYYRARNMMHMVDRYAEGNPKYAADTLGGIMNLYKFVERDAGAGDEALAIMLGVKDHAEGRWLSYDEALEELKDAASQA